MSIPPELIAFVAGFPILLAHLGIAVTAFILWAAVYTLLSRGQEIAQIQNGNPASSVIYGATLLALAVPLGRALSTSTGLLDIAIWTGAAGLVQLTLFGLVDLILAGLTARIRDEQDVSGAILLSAARISVAWLFCSSFMV
jgi:putative membrane protein